MKLTNFDDIFSDIIKKLNIETKTDFNAEVNIDSLEWKEIIRKGKEIDFNELVIYKDYTLGVRDEFGTGRRVLLYINNQFYSPEYPNREYKFHISWCKKLEEMKQKGQVKNYMIARSEEPFFRVNVIHTVTKRSKINPRQEMHVCKFCLEKLNYKGYAKLPYASKGTSYNPREDLYQSFQLKEFIEEYGAKDTEELINIHL